MSDYISRADAICEVLVNDGIDNIVDRINALPSADAVSREDTATLNSPISIQAVHGEWIEREDWNGDYYYDCSVCGESFVLCDGTPSMNLYHFCPNCGARMKGGAE